MAKLNKFVLGFGVLALGWAGQRAFSQSEHLRAVGEAAGEAGLVSKSEAAKPESSRTVRQYALAFDPGAPFDALQRFIYLAANAPLQAGKPGEPRKTEILPQQLCTLLESINADSAFKSNKEWKAVGIVYEPLINKFLYRKDERSPKKCGAGFLAKIRVTEIGESRNGVAAPRRVELLFTGAGMQQALPELDRVYYLKDAERDASTNLYKASLMIDFDAAKSQAFVARYKSGNKALLFMSASDYDTFKGNKLSTQKIAANRIEAERVFDAAVAKYPPGSDGLKQAAGTFLKTYDKNENLYYGRQAMDDSAKMNSINVYPDPAGRGSLSMKQGAFTVDVNWMTILSPPSGSGPMAMMADVIWHGQKFQRGYGGRSQK